MSGIFENALRDLEARVAQLRRQEATVMQRPGVGLSLAAELLAPLARSEGASPIRFSAAIMSSPLLFIPRVREALATEIVSKPGDSIF